jgi:hypothetical protein
LLPFASGIHSIRSTESKFPAARLTVLNKPVYPCSSSLSSSFVSMSEGRPGLKVLLAASQALLRPPEPLPSSPPVLVARLRSASALLPEAWRLAQQGWHPDTELEQVGDDDLRDAPRRRERREGLLLVVGWRCFTLLREMQLWLEKEFWPVEERPGLNDQDCERVYVHRLRRS